MQTTRTKTVIVDGTRPAFNALSLGRVAEAIDAAESAAFHAANVAIHHLPPGPDKWRVVDALLGLDNGYRRITDSHSIRADREREDFEYGLRGRSAAGRAFERIEQGRQWATRPVGGDS